MFYFRPSITLLAASPLVLAFRQQSYPYTYGNATINYKATFGDNPQPFQIDVDPAFVSFTKLKARWTRYTNNIDIPDFLDGPPKHNVTAIRNYWANEFDWLIVQAELNAKYKQFTTTVGAGPNYTFPVPLHFVHHRSPRKDAIPLLHIHSSPGSFIEVGNLIDQLTNPPNDSLPAFHVVAADIPGYGFSPAPEHPGCGLRATGHAFNNLMIQLDYKAYVVTGGDFGAFTARHMAADFPDAVMSMLSNMYLVFPNATDLKRQANNQTTPLENMNIALLNELVNEDGYAAIQRTNPLQLAIGMTDSPVGTAAWIYEIMFRGAPGYPWALKDIVTWAMIQYIPGPYGAFRMYKEATADGSYTNHYPFVHQPVGVTEYEYDVGSLVPLDWCQRSANVTYFNRNLTYGAHYPSTVNPSSLLQVYWEFWGRSALSGPSALPP